MTQIIGSGGGCFVGETYIRTPDGVQRIENLKVGDKVVSFDDRGAFHEALVLKVHKHENEQIYKYNFWGGSSFVSTPNHWVLNQFNTFTAISFLGSDDCVVDVNNHLLPIINNEDKGVGTVYNLTVEGQHTFIADNIRVHNAGLGPGAGGTRKIIGAGGGGGSKGGGHTPTTAPDSLDSKSHANVLDLISEGECEGLSDGLKSVFFNNTPLQNADGSSNFDNVTLTTREGTSSQTLIYGFDKASATTSVNSEVKKSIPVTRTVATSNSTNAVRVIVRIPSLQNIEDDGDIVGTSVRIKIYLIVNGGTPDEKIDDTISGRTGDLYKKDYLITLPATSFTSAEIRIARETNDSSDSRLSNQTWWDSYVKITYTDNTYPNSALCGIRVNAEQFQSIPQRAYLYRGIKTRIPSNATVDSATGALIYSGVWDGTFSAATWNADPCWCLWDLLTSIRYGLGSHILTATEQASFSGNASRLDKWAFYAASKYCSANNTRPSNPNNDYGPNGKHGIEDGFGRHEPRFSCNINIQSKTEAFTLINSMASVFRGMPYWSTGSLTVAQDKNQTSAFLFTLANVAEGGFTYSGSSQKTRTTVAVVKYFDKTLRSYAYEEVKDDDSIARYGVITKNVEAFACTSRGQAHRVGKWLLYSEGNETETITFTTSLAAGIVCRPGQVIDVSDPVKAGVRRGGRIKGNRAGSYTQTDTTITIDCAGHGLIAGQDISINFVDGGADGDDGTFTAGAVTSDGFTVTSSTSRTASGTLILNQAPTSTTIMVDGSSANTNLPPNGVSYTRTLHVVNAGGMVETREISSITGSVITVSSSFDMTPLPNDIWVIETTGGTSADNIQTTQWRVISVTEEEGVNYQVTALSYNSSKYGYVEEGLSLTQRDFTNLNELPATPGRTMTGTYSISSEVNTITSAGHGFSSSDVGRIINLDFTSGVGIDNAYTIASIVDANSFTVADTDSGNTSGNVNITTLKAFQQLYKKGTSILTKIVFSWDSVSGVNEYEVRWRKDLGNWNVSRQQSPDAEIRDVTTGTYDFKIFSLNGGRIPSTEPLTGTLVCVGKTRAPSQVTGFTNELSPHIGLVLKWDKLVGVYPNFDDLDVVGYEIRSSDTAWGQGNNGGNLIARVTANSHKVGNIASGAQPFFIRAFDENAVSNGTIGYSATSASQSINVQAPLKPTFDTAETGIQGDFAVVTWNAVSTIGRYAIDVYEVYEDSVNSSNLLGEIATTRFSTPVTWTGVKTFLVRAKDIAGNIGNALSTAELSPAGINNIPAAAPTIAVSFVDTNVKLSWTEVHGSTQTRSYVIKRGDSYGTAASQGTVKGTDFTVPLDWMTSGHDGTEKYWVTALDANGNEGAEGSVDVVFNAPSIPTISSVFSGEQAVITWSAVTGGSLAVSEYEIRRGSVFDSATTLKTVDATTFSVQVDWGGVQKFWVVGVDLQGNVGTPGSIDISVTAPKAPTTFEQEVIDNNVLLRWSDSKESLPIVVYKIRKGDTWAGGTDIGTKQGLFTTVFETSSGRFTYRIRGVDTAGNEGAESTVSASVNQPPDYILRSDINSDFTGTKTNVFTDTLTSFLYANVNTTQTWKQHFDAMSWTTLQDQVSAGYSIYGLPSETSGSYVQEVDYGTVLAGTKVVMALTGEHVIGSTTITPKISTKKLSGDSWTDFPGTASTDSNLRYSAFSTDFQFVRYELAFGSSGNDDLLKMTALNLRLETKQIGDSGNGTASASDSGGTTVNFNVNFVDVESITVTPKGTNPRIGIYDFTDVANPTSFKVFLYDTSGNRQSGDFSWQARGS